MKTVIMAGGKGTRIKSVVPNVPKPMIEIGGIPILEHTINNVKKEGLKDIIITVSHMSEQIVEYFGNGKKFGVNIEYYHEDIPLGSAGALFKISDKLTDDFLLINGDIMFDVDFSRMIDFHYKKNGLATILTHPNDHPYDSGLIVSDKNNKVITWLNKEDKRDFWYKNRVNAGIHILKKSIFINKTNNINLNENIVDLDRDILKPLTIKGELYCYDSPEYVKDMGTPDRLEKVEKDYLKGKISSKNLKNKQKAIFIDRDGVINKYVGFITKESQFIIEDKVSEALKLINNSDFLAIIITNQPVIARGECTINELENIHNKMETLLGREGSYIDNIYYCPHHPDSGFEGEVKEYKINCECRKPNPGMIIKASEDYNIDLSKSWIIGDSESDILAGKKSGCNTCYIGNDNYFQDISANNLYEFVEILIKKEILK